MWLATTHRRIASAFSCNSTVMRLAAAVVVFVSIAGAATAAPAQRIVSLNVCTDQLIMMLAEPERIAALSFLARDPAMSVLSDAAAKLPVSNATAEDVYVLKPDLVVTGTFTERATVDILRRLGVKVAEFAPAASFDDIRANIRRLGELLDVRDRAEHLIADFDAKLRALDEMKGNRGARAALYYANGYTVGRDTLAAEVLARAGLENLAKSMNIVGTAKLPLESLVMAEPDLVITGPLNATRPALAQEVLSHPALRYLQARSGSALVADNLWICGTPFVADAVALLIDAKNALSEETAALTRPTRRSEAPTSALQPR